MNRCGCANSNPNCRCNQTGQVPVDTKSLPELLLVVVGVVAAALGVAWVATGEAVGAHPVDITKPNSSRSRSHRRRKSR
jgi:hypothetical protein